MVVLPAPLGPSTATTAPARTCRSTPARACSRSDQPVRPQLSRQEPDQDGEDRTVGPVQAGPGMGAARHGDLVPRHQQFRVLGRRRTAEQHKPAADPDEDQVEQAKGHGRASWPTGDPGTSLQLHRTGSLLAPHRPYVAIWRPGSPAFAQAAFQTCRKLDQGSWARSCADRSGRARSARPCGHSRPLTCAIACNSFRN